MSRAPACPQCGSRKVWKDGLRYTSNGAIQRYLCRSCGYRFSESSTTKPRNLASHKTSSCRVGVAGSRPASKNSAKAVQALKQLERKEAMGLRGPTQKQKAKGAIISFAWNLKKEGYAEGTIQSYVARLKDLLKHGADLFNPESVKETIAKRESWSDSTKFMAVAAYSAFAGMNGIKWNPPKYKPNRKLPFIPLEKELDALIASCGKKTSALLQLLKETGMRIGEALRLKWTDIDFERSVITLNLPEKRSEPRIFKASKKLLSMLNRLPKTSEKVFGGITRASATRTFQTQRKRAAIKLGNPRLLRITFHTFRHWKATMEYHKTRDILHVMKLLGHKNIQNTLIYTQLINFEKKEYHSAVAKTTEEARQLIETGFEYVCTTPEGTMLFRKRK